MTGYALSSWAYGCWPLALVLVLAGLLAWSIMRRPESDDEPLSPGSLPVWRGNAARAEWPDPTEEA